MHPTNRLLDTDSNHCDLCKNGTSTLYIWNMRRKTIRFHIESGEMLQHMHVVHKIC